MQKATGSYLHLFIPSKTATLVPESAVVDLLWVELQPWCVRFQRKTCPWAEHSAAAAAAADDDHDHVFL